MACVKFPYLQRIDCEHDSCSHSTRAAETGDRPADALRDMQRRGSHLDGSAGPMGRADRCYAAGRVHCFHLDQADGDAERYVPV